jgi:gamma-glutamyltranspeptidase/glutathione hydrolase
LREAVVAPRVHDQAAPPVLAVEAGVEPSVRGVLERLGHRVVVAPTIGAVSACGLAGDGTPVAAGDPRKDGGAAVVP